MAAPARRHRDPVALTGSGRSCMIRPSTALYARVSTDEQAEHGTSLDVQLEECRAHAVRLGAAETVPYVDGGISGTLLERPALARMRADAQEGRIAQVVCYDPDRLSRNLGHLLLLMDEFRRFGVPVEFTNFTMSQSPDGRLLFAMRGAIAEFETHKIRQRMTAGKLARAREGRPVGGGHQIYGYVYDKADKRFVPDPVESAVVRHIFRLAEEYGTHGIAARLNEAGVPAKQGGPWSQTSVYGIVRNPTYLGRMPQMGGAGHVPVPPLVDEDAWQRAQDAMNTRRNRPSGPARRPYLLSGHLRCGVCGRRMGGGYGRASGDGYITRYACSGKRSRPPCPSSYYRSDKVDAAVWQTVRTLIAVCDDAWAVARHLADRLPRTTTGDAGAAEAAIERQRQRIWQAYRTGLMDETTLRRQLSEIDASAELVSHEQSASVSAGSEAPDELVRQVTAHVAASVRMEDKRLAVEALGLEVTLGPGETAVLRLAPPER